MAGRLPTAVLISISFTNTIANLPPWGGLDPRLGNNPLVIAVPRAAGHVVLDMAISQYAYGKLQRYKANNEQLPLPGGYDNAGHLSTNPAAIIESKRTLPIGFWKGFGPGPGTRFNGDCFKRRQLYSKNH